MIRKIGGAQLADVLVVDSGASDMGRMGRSEFWLRKAAIVKSNPYAV